MLPTLLAFGFFALIGTIFKGVRSSVKERQMDIDQFENSSWGKNPFDKSK